MKPCFLIALLLLASSAFADITAGDQAFNEGDYQAAITAYQDSLADADVAVQVKAYYKLAKAMTFRAAELSGDEAVRMYEVAADQARQAIELDPEEPNGYFELARALGRLAQFRGVLQSLSLAGKVKDALETTLELDPNHDGAMHALALWHLEVPWIAGGRTGEIKPLFEQAIRLDPFSIIHHTDYGEALLRLGEPEAAKEQLEAALSLPATTAAERADQARAQQLYEENF